MATKADYFGVMEAIKVVISNDADVDIALNKLVVTVVEWPEIIGDDENRIYISEVTRTVPDDQPIAGGTRMYFDATFRILVSVWDLEYKDAVTFRDSVLGDVEIAMMRNRKIGDTVAYSTITGGDILSGQAPGGSGFLSEGEVLVTVRMKPVII